MRRLFAGLLFVVACGTNATGPTGIVGTWNLVSVDSKALPVTLLDSSATTICGVVVVAGRYSFSADGTYSGKETYGCRSSYVEGGTYTLTDSVVSLQNAGGYTHTLSIQGSAISRTSEDGDTYVYHR